MKIILNRFFIVLNALGIYILTYFSRKSNSGKKKILIVFQQIFGDSIVIADSLKEYTKIYPIQDGYEVVLLARPSVLAFMKENLCLPSDIQYRSLDFKKYLEDYTYFRLCNKEFYDKVCTIIVPGTSLSAEIFAASCNVERKVGLVRSSDVKGGFVTTLFSKIAYTETVRPNKEDMMLQRHRLLLNYLGATEYKAKLPVLLPKDKVIDEQRYCVLCPGSSKMEKCWPTERFAKVADYIVENYDMNVHLCGGQEEAVFEKLICSRMRHPERVVSHIGKTSFSDWSSIVQHADLVVGNDSATMHLAAASRRKAICIAGVYDKYQFFPYKVDVLEKGDRLPNTVIKDMPCEWCRTIGYDAGFGNAECKKRINADKCALCIDAITVQDVINQVKLEMEG